MENVNRGCVMTKKKLLIAIAMLGAAAGSAGAADLARPIYKAPIVAAVPAFSWTGCYIGAHGGYGWGRNRNRFGDAIFSGLTEGTLPNFPVHDTKHIIKIGVNYLFGVGPALVHAAY